MDHSEYSEKKTNDIGLYGVVCDIDRILGWTGNIADSLIGILKPMTIYYEEEIEIEKINFIGKLMFYFEMDYQSSFEETYILKEDGKEIKKMLEEEYGGPLV